MKYRKYSRNGILLLIGLMIMLLYATVPKDAGAGDLKELQQRGDQEGMTAWTLRS
jgi:hypothetical protein